MSALSDAWRAQVTASAPTGAVPTPAQYAAALNAAEDDATVARAHRRTTARNLNDARIAVAAAVYADARAAHDAKQATERLSRIFRSAVDAGYDVHCDPDGPTGFTVTPGTYSPAPTTTPPAPTEGPSMTAPAPSAHANLIASRLMTLEAIHHSARKAQYVTADVDAQAAAQVDAARAALDAAQDTRTATKVGAAAAVDAVNRTAAASNAAHREARAAGFDVTYVETSPGTLTVRVVRADATNGASA